MDPTKNWRRFRNTKYHVSSEGDVWSGFVRRLLRQSSSSHGYLRVGVRLPSGTKTLLVHRMVAELFCPGRSEERNVVNHIDGDTFHNDHRNLEWCTTKENTERSQRRRYSDFYTSLANIPTEEIWALHASGEWSWARLTKHFSLPPYIIMRAIVQERAKYLPNQRRSIERLDPKEVLAVREKLAEGLPPQVVADNLGLHLHNVQIIRNEHAYQWVASEKSVPPKPGPKPVPRPPKAEDPYATRKGERHACAKVTPSVVHRFYQEVFWFLRPAYKVAQDLGFKGPTIDHILKGKHWTQRQGKVLPPDQWKENNPPPPDIEVEGPEALLTADLVNQIYRLTAEGHSLRTIRTHMPDGIGEALAAKVLKGQTERQLRGDLPRQGQCSFLRDAA